MFEYVDALFMGLHIEKYVEGSEVCASMIKNTEKSLVYMIKYLTKGGGLEPATYDDWEKLIFNITLSTAPYIPFASYWCYSVPYKTQVAWISHYDDF